jgi:hypothetical protein
MHLRKTAVCLSVFALACTSDLTVSPKVLTDATAPNNLRINPPIRVQTPANASGEIRVGEVVSGVLTANGDSRVYALIARTRGTVTLRVTWDPRHGALELWIGDRLLVPSGDGSPIVARVRVIAGEKYGVRVADAAPWDYGGLYLPFTLSASIE